jgi:hypothetical protein
MPIPATTVRRISSERLGLSQLGKLDWIARLRRETDARFKLVLDATCGHRTGVIRLSGIDRIKLSLKPKHLGEAYIIAVLQLHGYTAEQVDLGIAFQKESNQHAERQSTT